MPLYLNEYNLNAVENYNKAINKEVEKLNNPIFSTYYNDGKLLTYIDYCNKLDENLQQIIFDISSLINDYSVVEKWTFKKIICYLSSLFAQTLFLSSSCNLIV